MMKLKSTFFKRNNTSDIYHEFEETDDKGKMKLLFKNKASPGSFFSPLRRADGSFPAATTSNYSTSLSGDDYGCYDNDERDDVAALSHDFVDSSRMQPGMEQPTLSPISEGTKRIDSSEEDSPAAGSESLDLLPLPQYESFSTAEDDASIADENKDTFWSTEWEPPPNTDFPPPPSVSDVSMSEDDRRTLATQSITDGDESSKLFPDDYTSISSSSTEKRDNSSGLFPISECSQSEAPKQVSPKPKCAEVSKTLVESGSDLKALERELQARLDVIHTLKRVIMKQGDVITTQKKTIKRHERKLDESRSVIKCLYRQHVRFKGQISHLELEAELHEARAMWSKQELFTVRTELHDMKSGFAGGELGCKDARKGDLKHYQRKELYKDATPLIQNETISTAESSAEDKNTEESKKLTIMDQASNQGVACARKVEGALELDDYSTDNTLLFAASSNDSDSLGFTPKSLMHDAGI